jgi:GNAT superfamily N-acetyltransferase
MSMRATASPAPAATPGWRVRAARLRDVQAIADALTQLLVELDGTPPPKTAMEVAAGCLVEDQAAGAVLVAEADGTIVGVLAASWQTAIHVPGRYGLIQDLWVDPARRSQAIGAALVAELCLLAGEQGIARLEVGLPRERFAAIGPTTAFYRREGFATLGPRMRRILT